MRVLDADDECYGWFLLEEDGSLFLEASCNHSFVGYTFMIQLNAHEVDEYKQQGRACLHQLAQYIQDSVPIHKATQSIYKGRDVSSAYMEKAIAAVNAWRNAGSQAGSSAVE